MKFVLLSCPLFDNQELSLLPVFFEQGLEIYHLRKPTFLIVEMEAYIQRIPCQYYQNIILHSHHCLVEKYQLKGCHFTEENRQNMSNDFLKKNEYVYSTGFHNIEEAVNHFFEWDYIFLSPIFDSISKNDYKSSFTLEQLKREGKQLFEEKTVIALGGIQKEDIPLLKEIGFEGFAMIGTIWNSQNPLKSFQEIITVE